MKPTLYRVYQGELLTLSEIARRSGFSRGAVERAAKRSHDVTARLTWLRQRRDMRLVADALGLSRATVRMRLSRGKSVAEALRA